MVRARSRDRDRQALLDALIVTTGLGLVVWVFLAAPYVQDGTMTATEKGFSIAYPLGDVLLLAVLARLLTGRGAHSSSLRLLTLGTVGLLASDVLYGLIQLDGSWQTGGLVDLGWIVFYVAWGAAALQPDMVQLAEPVRLPPQVLSREAVVPPRVGLLDAAGRPARRGPHPRPARCRRQRPCFGRDLLARDPAAQRSGASGQAVGAAGERASAYR